MSYPKKCDSCDQFGDWCFCEPADSTPTEMKISKLNEAWFKLREENQKAQIGVGVAVKSEGDLYIPAHLTTQAHVELKEDMVIWEFVHRDFEDEIGECTDRVRVGRGIK